MWFLEIFRRALTIEAPWRGLSHIARQRPANGPGDRALAPDPSLIVPNLNKASPSVKLAWAYGQRLRSTARTTNCIFWSMIIVMTCRPACKSGLPAAQHTCRDEVRFAQSAIRSAGALHRRSRLCMTDEGVAYR